MMIFFDLSHDMINLSKGLIFMRLYSNRAGKIIPVNSGDSCYVPRSLGDISIESD